MIKGIRTCLEVFDDLMFLWISSNSCPVDLLLVRSHQAEIIIVKRLIQGCNNVTNRGRAEPRSYDQGRVVNGPTSSGPNSKTQVRTRKLRKSPNHARKKPKVMIDLKNLVMLPSYFDYIFVHVTQKACFRPELSPKFLSSLGPNPTRKARPDLQLCVDALTLYRNYCKCRLLDHNILTREVLVRPSYGFDSGFRELNLWGLGYNGRVKISGVNKSRTVVCLKPFFFNST